jgi:hypothetical protein
VEKTTTQRGADPKIPLWSDMQPMQSHAAAPLQKQPMTSQHEDRYETLHEILEEVVNNN